MSLQLSVLRSLLAELCCIDACNTFAEFESAKAFVRNQFSKITVNLTAIWLSVREVTALLLANDSSKEGDHVSLNSN